MTKMIMMKKKIVCYDNCVRVHIKQFKFSNSFHLLLKKIMYEKNLSIVWRDYNLILYFMKRCCIRRLELYMRCWKKKVLLARCCYCLKSFARFFFLYVSFEQKKMHFTQFFGSHINITYVFTWKTHMHSNNC